MDTDYRYKLDSPKVTGHRQQKTRCPHCGRAKCFVRYVDTHDQCRYLSDEVGRCDHEQSCGYHYRPSDYFRDHPWLTDKAMQKPVEWKTMPKPLPPPLQPLSSELLAQYHSPRSTFWHWMSTECARRLNLSAEVLQGIYDDYHIGATQSGDVVFWQIDEQQRVRSGHIMQYGPDGHRRNFQNWMHSILVRQGKLPQSFELQQCLFGQHLLPRYPERHVCIVESEKTALVMAAYQSQYLWLATCGSHGLKAEKLESLRGRRFTLFPDSGCFNKWQIIMQETTGMQYNIDDSLEQYPTNSDLADLLLKPP